MTYFRTLRRGARERIYGRPVNFISGVVEIMVDGGPVRAKRGMTVAAALIAANRPVLRRSPRAGTPRGVHCGMGHCFECLVTIDGTPGRRACLVEVRAGMVVERGP